MSTNSGKSPWNKGKLVGQKLPLKLKEIWAIRVRLQLADNKRDLALFNLAIDSKLRGSDLIKIKVSDISNSGVVSARAMVLQQKTTQPVQFEITEGTRESITDWLSLCGASGADYLFPSRISLRRTCPLGSTPELWNDGSQISVWTAGCTALIRCVARNQR